MHSGKFRLEATLLFGMELEQAINYVETQLANPEAADRLQADAESAVRERLSSPTNSPLTRPSSSRSPSPAQTAKRKFPSSMATPLR